VLLSVFHAPSKNLFESFAARFQTEKVFEKLHALDSRAHRKGLDALDPAQNPLVSIGMEIGPRQRVVKNSYGVFNLGWQAEQHPEWARQIEDEADGLRSAIKSAHNVPLRFLIWAGMGGSAEDKSMYNALGLLNHSPRCYVLDSTDPAKLKYILEDMVRRSRLPLGQVLRGTLVVGMAMGMTSYEPVVNLEKLAALYQKNRIDGRANFIYMTLPGSLLDQFGKKNGFRRVELQPDGANSTAGRHSAPLTRGSLYPLALGRVDLRSWIDGTSLTGERIQTAWRLAAFIHAQGVEGRDKLTLVLPKAWAGAAIWTKQDFEESLGKREDLGLKIVIGEKHRLADYRSPKDPLQDRAFLAVQIKGERNGDSQKIATLRRAGYPVAVLTLPAGSPLSRYMQFMHYVVFGVAWLRNMNFVTQPGVELYKAIANRIYAEAQKTGGIENTKAWQAMTSSPRQAKWCNGLTLHYDRLPLEIAPGEEDAPRIYANLLKTLAAGRQIEYGELTFFGDTRFSPGGKRMRRSLDHAAEKLFRSRLKLPVDVYEGPAMNHSYHEMIIGHGKCFSTVLLSRKQEQLPAAGYTADYHMAQFLATQMALAERGRPVVAISVKDLEERTLQTLDAFFAQAAAHAK
jgi:glucose-6-phosphate isomerase